MQEISLQALVFLINTAFDLYLYVLVIRLILVWVYADYNLPITQFIVRLTTVVVKPLRRFLPDYKRIEVSTLVLILVISMVKYFLIISMTFKFSHVYGVLGLVLLAFGDLIKMIITVLSVAILFQALLSWIQPNVPINRELMLVTTPILRPVQRFMPLVNGIDLSPIVALILLQLIMIVVVTPLSGEGFSIAIS